VESFHSIIFDETVKSRKSPVFVIPAQARIQGNQGVLGSRFRRSDGFGDFLRFHQFWLNQKKVDIVAGYVMSSKTARKRRLV